MQIPNSCSAAFVVLQCGISDYVQFRQSIPDRRTALKDGPMFISRFVKLLQTWWRYNESVRELARLNDRELADIGISRSEIQMIAWNNARS